MLLLSYAASHDSISEETSSLKCFAETPNKKNKPGSFKQGPLLLQKTRRETETPSLPY